MRPTWTPMVIDNATGTSPLWADPKVLAPYRDADRDFLSDPVAMLAP